MENKVEEILTALNIAEDVIGIFAYGSRVYGTATENSDYDYIIVTKGAFLKSGGFRQNAISSSDRKIQGVLYSRSGFIDAINNYDIAVLECLFLDRKDVLLMKWPFKIQKWETKVLVEKLIQKASASWYIATQQIKDDYKEIAKKGIFHSLRILMFGLQLKEYGKIIDFTVANSLKTEIDNFDLNEFDEKTYLTMRNNLMLKLRNENNSTSSTN